VRHGASVNLRFVELHVHGLAANEALAVREVDELIGVVRGEQPVKLVDRFGGESLVEDDLGLVSCVGEWVGANDCKLCHVVRF